MVVDSKQLISDIVLDTDNKMHKQCKFCGKLLHINDYTALYVNIVYKDIATAYERCTCNEASKIWQEYDEYIEKDKIRKINLSKINKLFKNNNLGKRQLNSTFENYKITNKNKEPYNILLVHTNSIAHCIFYHSTFPSSGFQELYIFNIFHM